MLKESHVMFKTSARGILSKSAARWNRPLVSQISLLVVFFFVALAFATPIQAQEKPTATTTPATDADAFKSLQWRLIGPFRGGRSTAVAGVASQPMVYYFGGTGGGVW